MPLVFDDYTEERTWQGGKDSVAFLRGDTPQEMAKKKTPDWPDDLLANEFVVHRDKMIQTFQMEPISSLTNSAKPSKRGKTPAQVALAADGNCQGRLGDCPCAAAIELAMGHSPIVVKMTKKGLNYDSAHALPFYLKFGTQTVCIYTNNCVISKCGRHAGIHNPKLRLPSHLECVLAKVRGGVPQLDCGGVAATFLQMLTHGYVTAWNPRELTPMEAVKVLHTAFENCLLIAVSSFEQDNIVFHKEIRDSHYFVGKKVIFCFLFGVPDALLIFKDTSGKEIEGPFHPSGHLFKHLDPVTQDMLLDLFKVKGTTAMRVGDLKRRIDRVEICQPSLPLLPKPEDGPKDATYKDSAGRDVQSTVWVQEGEVTRSGGPKLFKERVPPGTYQIEAIVLEKYKGLSDWKSVGVRIVKDGAAVVGEVLEAGHAAIAFLVEDAPELTIEVCTMSEELHFSLVFVRTLNPPPDAALPETHANYSSLGNRRKQAAAERRARSLEAIVSDNNNPTLETQKRPPSPSLVESAPIKKQSRMHALSSNHTASDLPLFQEQRADGQRDVSVAPSATLCHSKACDTTIPTNQPASSDSPLTLKDRECEQ